MKIAHFIVSFRKQITFLLAVAFVFLGSVAADVFDLPFIHGWALMHGSIIVMFPIYYLLSYLLILPLARHFPTEEAIPEPAEKTHV